MNGLSGVLLWGACIGGWVQHVFRCVEADYVGFLFVGMFIPPIGVVHGWIVWLSALAT